MVLMKASPENSIFEFFPVVLVAAGVQFPVEASVKVVEQLVHTAAEVQTWQFDEHAAHPGKLVMIPAPH